jgi:hypothetical protein
MYVYMFIHIVSTKKVDVSPIKSFFGFGKKDHGDDDKNKINHSDKNEDKKPALTIQTDDLSSKKDERQESPKPSSSFKLSIESPRESIIFQFIEDIRAQSDSTPGKLRDDHIYRFDIYMYACMYNKSIRIYICTYKYVYTYIDMYICIYI